MPRVTSKLHWGLQVDYIHRTIKAWHALLRKQRMPPITAHHDPLPGSAPTLTRLPAAPQLRKQVLPFLLLNWPFKPPRGVISVLNLERD